MLYSYSFGAEYRDTKADIGIKFKIFPFLGQNILETGKVRTLENMVEMARMCHY